MDEVQLGTWVSVVLTEAVPEQIAVPSDRTAEEGGLSGLAPMPPAVMVRGAPVAIAFVPVKATVAVAPVEPLKRVRLQVCPAVPKMGPTAIVMGPVQVAVPFESVAVVGCAVAPEPTTEMLSWVPLAIVFAPVKATDAVAPVKPLLKPLTTQVCPADPVIVPPDTYSAAVRLPEKTGGAVKVPLAMMSGGTLMMSGGVQAKLALVIEAGAHSSTCWLLLFA